MISENKYENLSKAKYLYRVTYTRTGRFDLTKHPIVYSNKRYVYIKNHVPNSMLIFVLTDTVKDSIMSIKKEIDKSSFGQLPSLISGYYWGVEDDAKEIIADIKNRFKTIVKENEQKEKLKAAKRTLDRKQAELSEAMKIYERLLEDMK